MADVAENTAAQPVTEEKVEKAENGEKGEAAVNGANGDEVAEKGAEKGADNDAAETKSGEKNGAGEKRERYERNDRKRRGSFNGDRGGRGRGRGDFNKRGRGNHNNKSRFEDLPESDDADEIRRQVDFYFSDSNLPTDRFLLGLTGGHENKPVPLKTIHDFKRMRHFQPYSAVRDAVASSHFLNLNDQDEITRKQPLSDKFTDNIHENKNIAQSATIVRSTYAKGFGEENPRTQLEIEEFFEPYGPIASVRLRRAEDGLFKGSVFVEFESEELQKQFLELDPKPTFGDKELKIMSKQEYVDKKNEDIRDGKVKPRSPDRYRNGGGRSFDKDDWKSRRDQDQRGGDRGGRGRGRGRGNGRGGRGGGRNDRQRNRSRSPKKDDAPSRAEAEATREQPNGETKAGADAPEAKESKKRAREDDGDADKGEAKKAKENAPAES